MSWFEQTIREKKQTLRLLTAEPMAELARACVPLWEENEALDLLLQKDIPLLPHCHMIYAVDTSGHLISSNINAQHRDSSWRGIDVSDRPYLETRLPYQGYTISHVYISEQTNKSCITVMNPVRDGLTVRGFIGADFDVEDLPASRDSIEANEQTWIQYKGDPAIRSTLFMQERALSAMDKCLDEVIDIIIDMMQHHGIFHTKIHFSSSRASFWSMDDPYTYHINTVDELVNPDRCLAYPRQPLAERAQLNNDDIARVLNLFKQLRNADETIYLRSSSFNIINGMVGLTFSCDGSHYIPWREFLSKNIEFWFGGSRRVEK
ncbi:hypothetical protein MNBD_GAMMA25-201 [hydrothermal vent metagenome]|uniref:Uncharacterized protein n=1 Tax=hydrothermal vent metagenome TaxID=652676 RepID=A0A3B1BHJ9_9ZZZZ